jgi:hypothetical protein
MGNSTQRSFPWAAGLLALLGLWGCAGALPLVSGGYDYFGSPDRGDPWSRKIGYWQARERADRTGPPPPAELATAVAGAGGEERAAAGVESLEEKYVAFRAEHKRALARDLADWIQVQARQHYVPDVGVDEWATLEETLRNNGDDCDGLELLVFNTLRDLGFDDDEVFRAIVYRESDGQHHMVTLWFEDRDDPWVIDPTGAMTSGMPHMSDLPAWVPLKVFSDDRDFTVRRERVAASHP